MIIFLKSIANAGPIIFVNFTKKFLLKIKVSESSKNQLKSHCHKIAVFCLNISVGVFDVCKILLSFFDFVADSLYSTRKNNLWFTMP